MSKRALLLNTRVSILSGMTTAELRALTQDLPRTGTVLVGKDRHDIVTPAVLTNRETQPVALIVFRQQSTLTDFVGVPGDERRPVVPSPVPFRGQRPPTGAHWRDVLGRTYRVVTLATHVKDGSWYVITKCDTTRLVLAIPIDWWRTMMAGWQSAASRPACDVARSQPVG